MPLPVPPGPSWLENPLLRGLLIITSVAASVLLLGLGVWMAELIVQTLAKRPAVVAGLWLVAVAAPALFAWGAKGSQSRVLGLAGLLTFPVLLGAVLPFAGGLIRSWPAARAHWSGGPLFAMFGFASWGIQLVAVSSTLAAKPGARLSTVRDHALLAVMQHAGLVSAVTVTLPTMVWVAGASPRMPWFLLGTLVAVISVAASYGGGIVVTTLLRSVGRGVPEDLARVIDRVQGLCGMRFSGVIYLDAVIASTPVCMVTIDWRGCVLVVNARAWIGLDDAARHAVIVHEAAHVIHGHLARGAVVGVIAGCAAFTVSIALRGLLGLRGPLGVALSPTIVIAIALANAAIRRRWERQADTFAARIVGAEPLIAALAHLTTPGASSLLSTHDPISRRSALARESVREGRPQD
jgi:hypothetical protein